MGKVIVFANQKGGVGKTTTTVNIGAFMAQRGFKVLLIDFDPQANLSSAVGRHNAQKNIYTALLGQCDIADTIVDTPLPTLKLSPSHSDLSAAGPYLATQGAREYRLEKLIAPIKELYDFVLIDCPPSLDLLTINACVAADYIITPVQSEFFAAQGFLTMLFSSIIRIQKNLNSRLKLLGIVFTLYDSRTKLSNEVIEKIVGAVKNRALFFKTLIPRNVKLAEAPSHGLPINLYDAASLGAERYKQLTDEVIERSLNGGE
jgi:chromosome partitioning protein